MVGFAFVGIMLTCTSCREAGDKLLESKERVIVRSSSSDWSYLFMLNDEPVDWGVGFGSVELKGYPLRNGTNELKCVLSAYANEHSRPLQGRIEIVVIENEEVKEFRQFEQTLPEEGQEVFTHTFFLSNLNESDALQDFPATHGQCEEFLEETVLGQIEYLSRREYDAFAKTLPSPHDRYFAQALPRWILETPIDQLNISAITQKENLVVEKGKRLVLVRPSSPMKDLFRMTLETDNPVSFSYSCMRYCWVDNSWIMWTP